MPGFNDFDEMRGRLPLYWLWLDGEGFQDPAWTSGVGLVCDKWIVLKENGLTTNQYGMDWSHPAAIYGRKERDTEIKDYIQGSSVPPPVPLVTGCRV